MKNSQAPFPIGCRVRLRDWPNDDLERGIVVAHSNGRVLVRWPDWKRETSYLACSLVKSEEPTVS